MIPDQLINSAARKMLQNYVPAAEHEMGGMMTGMTMMGVRRCSEPAGRTPTTFWTCGTCANEHDQGTIRVDRMFGERRSR